MLMNKDLAKQICTPIGYSFLLFLEDKYKGDEDKMLEKWSDTIIFQRYYDFVKGNSDELDI